VTGAGVITAKRNAGTTRRKRPSLSRARLIAAGLQLLDRRGGDALTMRALADAVGVTPMALYNHFSSKRDLQAAVADHLIGGTSFDGGQAEWQTRLRHCFDALRRLCLRHPGLPALLETDDAAPASVFAPMEVTLQALRQAGLDELDSVRTFFLLVGFTPYQARGPVAALEPSEETRTRRIAGRGYAATERLALPPKWDFDESFAFGLSLLIAGIESTVGQRRRAAKPRRTR
jgi:TetR/AcrR family transcriptional regulator, tetracycline repressor protein